MKLIKRIKWFLKTKRKDPLSILREDTYSNEESDRISGEMHRKQYKESQK